jgi:hypothetical protein
MSLKSRIIRLEAGQEYRSCCRLCALILQAAGETPEAAEAQTRHPAHTLEDLATAAAERRRPPPSRP